MTIAVLDRVAPRADAQTPRPSANRAAKVLEIARRYYPPIPDENGDGGSGLFFRQPGIALGAGDHVLRCCVQLDEHVLWAGGTLRIDCLIRPLVSGRAPFASLSETIGPDFLSRADDLILRFHLASPARVEVRGHVTHGLGRVHLRLLQIHAPEPGEIVDYAHRPGPYASRPITRLRGVMIGTTGTCNASCPSCPTNKTIRDHLPSGVMAMELFRKIIDGLAAEEIRLEKNKIGLGLFGEPLMDPHIVARVKYIKQRMPRTKVLLNTNMGPFSERRHAELAVLVDRFSVHVEALSPELYDELMAPLRAAIVFPKIERLMALAPGKVNVAVPLSRRNAGEFAALRTHWMARGARNVCDLKFSNRTTDSLDYYRDSLGPTPNACAEGVRFDFVVDWDGKVLACCQDFLKREPLGDLTQSTVSEVLLTQQRARFVERLKSGHWNALRSCRHCKIDPQGQSHGPDED